MFKLPPMPPKEEIFFHNLPRKQQYWKRSELIKEFPSFFFDWDRGVEENAKSTRYEGRTLVSLSKADTDRLIELRDREIERILNGVWFYNNGEPTYVTGLHYGVLFWAAMYDCLNEVEQGSDYGSYYKFQATYAYFIEICRTTTVAKGGNVVKPKKTGITMFQELLMLMDAITHRSANYAVMSTKEDDATTINMNYVLYAVQKLPSILKPEYRNNLSAVYFQDTGKSSRGSAKKNTDTDPLNSTIQTVPTVWNGFDGAKRRVAHIDEQSKIKLDNKYDLTTLHNNAIATVMQGLVRVGYVIYTHYVSDTNDKSFRLAKKIYYEGKLKTINPDTGMTKSELICLPLTVYDGIFGGCDIYGEPDVEKIRKYVTSTMSAKKDDPAALRSFRRQFPETESACWEEAAGEASIFDNYRLGIQLQDIREDESVGAFPYIDFNFEWTEQPKIDEVKGVYQFPGKLKVVPVTNDDKIKGKDVGRWKWYKPDWSSADFLVRYTNRLGKDRRGNLAPNPDTPFYMSIDPTNYSAAKDVAVASMNAFHVFMLPNAEIDGKFQKRVTNKRLMVEYHYRADSPKDTLMHAVQTILYFGCYALIECNAPWLAARLKEWGLGNFLIVLNKETGLLEPYAEWKQDDQKPFTSQRSANGSSDTIGEYIAAGMNHLNDVENNNIDTLYSVDVMSDLMNFEPENTRSYDSGVCYLIGLYGINAYLGWKQKDKGRKHGIGDGSGKMIAEALLR